MKQVFKQFVESTPGFYSSALREREPLRAGVSERARLNEQGRYLSSHISQVLSPQNLLGKSEDCSSDCTDEFQPYLRAFGVHALNQTLDEGMKKPAKIGFVLNT